MIDRRDFLLGVSGVAAAGGALAMRPRETIDLLGDTDLESSLPRTFAGWGTDPDVRLVRPTTETSLSDRLYAQTLGRGYKRKAVTDGGPVMLLISYGAQQSDALQLHRPEACYPAYGFQILERRLPTLRWRDSEIPAVKLTAQLGNRVEDILYWTRIGNELPQTSAQQRAVRLSAAWDGYVGDGVLVRASKVRSGTRMAFDQLEAFAKDLLNASPPGLRTGLIGRR